MDFDYKNGLKQQKNTNFHAILSEWFVEFRVVTGCWIASWWMHRVQQKETTVPLYGRYWMRVPTLLSVTTEEYQGFPLDPLLPFCKEPSARESMACIGCTVRSVRIKNNLDYFGIHHILSSVIDCGVVPIRKIRCAQNMTKRIVPVFLHQGAVTRD